jgi:hypothetical protein
VQPDRGADRANSAICERDRQRRGQPDVVASHARQHAVDEPPDEALVFLLGSRYCETHRLSEIAWLLFEKTPLGWGRVQAICD